MNDENRPQLWMDSENGGLDPNIHSPLQFAFLAVRNGEIVDRANFHLRINPLVVTGEALNINQIDIRTPGFQTKSDFLRMYKSFMMKNFGFATQDSMPFFCGHNTFYDRPFLQKLVGEFDLAYYHRIDTMVLANVLRSEGMLPGIENLKLETLSNYLHVPPPARFHDALCDVEQTFEVYKRLRRVMRGEKIEPEQTVLPF